MASSFILAAEQRSIDACGARGSQGTEVSNAERLAVFRDWFISFRREAAPMLTAEQNAQGPDWLFARPVILANPAPSVRFSGAPKYAEAAAEGVRMGIVSCMKEQSAGNPTLASVYASSIQTWLEHHARLGVERFYLHLEDSEALAEMLQASRWAGVIELTEARDTRTHYFEKVGRQNAAVSAAIPRARAAGLTHLLHIDDDELLYTSLGSAALRAALAHAPAPAADLHLANLEALPPSAALRQVIATDCH